MPLVFTEEQIAKQYSAAMDSVNLINNLKAKPTLTDEETQSLKANKDHLKIMINKDFWTTEDLTPLQLASE